MCAISKNDPFDRERRKIIFIAIKSEITENKHMSLRKCI